MIRRLIAANARHALTFGGGALIAGGYAEPAMIQEAVGAATTLIGIVWSIAEKRARQ